MLERASKLRATIKANAVEGEGPWTLGEIERFQAAWLLHGRNWPELEKAVRTRKGPQVKSFAQKFLDKHPPSTWSTPAAPVDDATPPVPAEEAVRVQGPVAELPVVAELLVAIQDLRISRGGGAVDEIVASFTARVREATVSDAVGIDDVAGAAAGPSPVVEPPRQSSRQREARARARDAAGARTL